MLVNFELFIWFLYLAVNCNSIVLRWYSGSFFYSVKVISHIVII